MVRGNLTPPKKPTLRKYEYYISDMEDSAKRDADKMFNDTEMYPIRMLYDMIKRWKINLNGLRPVKKDRRKLCNRYMKMRIREAQDSYSRSLSSGKFNPPRD